MPALVTISIQSTVGWPMNKIMLSYDLMNIFEKKPTSKQIGLSFVFETLY